MAVDSTVALFAKTSRHGNLIFVAGATPRQDGVMKFTGMVGRDIDLVVGFEAARLAVRNAMSEAASAAESAGSHIEACHRMTVYCVVDEALKITQVADAASAQLRELLRSDAVGVRTAIAVARLPGNAPVEVELTVGVKSRNE